MQSASPDIVARLSAASKRFAGRSVLTDVDLAIRAGEIVVILGPNGAGKSTLAGLISGRLQPASGGVTLFGLHPRKPEARARLGVMLQDAGLPEGLTVREAVDLQAGYFRRRLKTADILEQTGLSALAKRRCDKLSGGERRRVQFALAIGGRPDLFVLDEPTAGVDPESRREIWRTVRAKAADGGAVVLATHHMDEAEALADRVVVIAGGRILVDGSPSLIKARAAGSTVKFRTAAPADQLAGLAAVIRASKDGAHATLLTTDPRSTLEALFVEHPAVSELEVASASLEEALADVVAAGQGRDV
ncbi:MAG: ABC transporter ATP-binding protein [Caulobacteraceae bacterium]|nr:ABC transporter ATP-binding protein [Caulobacteraceae bacterium]